MTINDYFQVKCELHSLVTTCAKVPGEKAAVACKIQNPQQHQRHPGTENFPSVFGGNLMAAFKRQWQEIFPKTEPRRALKLLETGTHPSSPPQHSAKGLVLLPVLRLDETYCFYSTQVLSKKYIVLHPGQKTLS